jgi:GPH family glycoside/pentoside/hexuronide:cation symporter
MNFVLFAGMTVLSLVFYAPVNILAKRMGKKKLVAFAFFFFCLAFLVTSVCGQFGVPELAWGALVAILAAIPMAVLGILPQAVLADIAESDAVETGENREGMFYAARTFSMTLGQSLAMILFTSISTVGTGGLGYRLTALVATVFCLVGGFVFTRYGEGRVIGTIEAAKLAVALPEDAGAPSKSGEEA